jgi:uncharacterized protein YkwD
MNWVDLILVLIFLLAVWSGYSRGFILGSLDLLSWAGSFIAAYMAYDYTKDLLAKLFDLNVWLLPVSFLLTFIIARLFFAIITKFIIRSFSGSRNENLLNKSLGLIPGAINGYIIAIITSALLLAVPFKHNINAEARNSKLVLRLAIQSEWANKKLAAVFDEAVRHTMNSLTVDQPSHEKVTLNFTYDDAKVRPFLEIEMLKMINVEREKHGLKPLKADTELTIVARAHSKDMFVRGYFAHENPEGKSPFDRMREANVKFNTAGENLALAQTLELAHINLMNSPGHRANILQPSFGRLGIGILDGGFYGLMISQEFRD